MNLDDGQAVDQFLHSPLWRTPTVVDYDRLADESEYAAWVIYNRYYLNHFTISVHNLPAPYNTIEKFNDLVESSGFRLNDSGGKVKTSSDGLLIQSSTVAEMVAAEFDDGRGGTTCKMIAGSYVEFAERKIKPESAGRLTSRAVTDETALKLATPIRFSKAPIALKQPNRSDRHSTYVFERSS
ncbi:MAG: DUF1338 family protein [Pirellulaceae bacterium]